MTVPLGLVALMSLVQASIFFLQPLGLAGCCRAGSRIHPGHVFTVALHSAPWSLRTFLHCLLWKKCLKVLDTAVNEQMDPALWSWLL